LGYTWQSPLYVQLNMNTFKKWDRPFTDAAYFTQEGFNCIKENPLVLLQSVESIPYLFMGNRSWPLNVSDYSRYMRVYELLFAIFSIVGLAVAFRWALGQQNKKQILVAWFVPVAALFLCVYIF